MASNDKAGYTIALNPTGSHSSINRADDGSARKSSWSMPFMRRQTSPQDTEAATHHVYRDIYGKDHKHKTVQHEHYLSGTRYRPRRLRVQHSKQGILAESPDWKRVDLEGDVPTALKWSEWILAPGFPKERGQAKIRWAGVPYSILLMIICALPLQLYMSFPFFNPPWNDEDAEDSYLEWPGYLWTWPRFAVNPLDMSPDPSSEKKVRQFSAKQRLLRPRLLVVCENDKWVVKNLDHDPHAWRPYVMISFTNAHFHTTAYETDTMSLEDRLEAREDAKKGRDRLVQIARDAARQYGVQAYWLDFQCRAPEDGELLDSDVNRFCDVVRGATQVVIALPDTSERAKLEWGQRLWTLPEGLLAPEHRVGIYYEANKEWSSMHKIEMAGTFWRTVRPDQADGGNWEATRQLAEHFTGTLTLSRLQLMSTALAALWDRNYLDPKKESDLTMALMGLLHTRIDPVGDREQVRGTFRELAKLSLLNDSDQLMERMLCLLPKDTRKTHARTCSIQRKDLPGTQPLPTDGVFATLHGEDEYNTHLWDIHPTCQVVGVAQEDYTVVLNETRAIPIRWKKFPRILYSRTRSWKKLAAEMFLRSGLWWFAFGFQLLYTYAPILIALAEDTAIRHLAKWLGAAVGLFLAVGLVLSIVSPLSLRILYGGVPVKASPHLVGFEGYMPIKDLEKVVFGNDGSRLTYSPSSTPFCMDFRDRVYREGVEPTWIREGKMPQLREGHRLFTLVDTGSMTVSLFQARKPPTVALICGREGGMLRAVLCRWRSDADCLYKETVMRMPTDLYDIAVPRGWLKLQLRDSRLP